MSDNNKRKAFPLFNHKTPTKKTKVSESKKVDCDIEKFTKCPICNKSVLIYRINEHLDECEVQQKKARIRF